MANVAHSTLTGANLHEPKGVATAPAGTVYVANGSGSGAWGSIGGGAPTGTIADFATPIAPSGWLECNGAFVTSAAFPALYAALTIQQTGTTTTGLTIITGLASTSNIVAGYSVTGTGIPDGTSVVTVDSSSQITVNLASTASGSVNIIVSPWRLSGSSIRLPNISDSGRYRRSRTTALPAIGTFLANENKTHTHTWTSTLVSAVGDHSHTINITDPGHLHTTSTGGNSGLVAAIGSIGSGAGPQYVNSGTLSTGTNTTGITASSVATGAHSHTVTGENSSYGIGEVRVETVVVLTCIKT